MADNESSASIFQQAATGDRAHEKHCTIVHDCVPLAAGSTAFLDNLLMLLAWKSARARQTMTIVDCPLLQQPDKAENPAEPEWMVANAYKNATPELYCLWVTPVATPSLFSLTCVCEHLRHQIVEGGKVAVSVFNDWGEEDDEMVGEGEERVGPGTYLVVLKRVEVEGMRCVPVSFSASEKRAVREYLGRGGDEDGDGDSFGEDVKDEKAVEEENGVEVGQGGRRRRWFNWLLFGK